MPVFLSGNYFTSHMFFLSIFRLGIYLFYSYIESWLQLRHDLQFNMSFPTCGYYIKDEKKSWTAIKLDKLRHVFFLGVQVYFYNARPFCIYHFRYPFSGDFLLLFYFIYLLIHSQVWYTNKVVGICMYFTLTE